METDLNEKQLRKLFEDAPPYQSFSKQNIIDGGSNTVIRNSNVSTFREQSMESGSANSIPKLPEK